MRRGRRGRSRVGVRASKEEIWEKKKKKKKKKKKR
jgi:hypothetical protein